MLVGGGGEDEETELLPEGECSLFVRSFSGSPVPLRRKGWDGYALVTPQDLACAT